MNDKNENFIRKIHILRRDMIYKLILTIFEALYITYIVYIGIALPRINIIAVLIGVHLAISIVDVYIMYKKD